MGLSFRFHDLPLDILPAIVGQLTDRSDLYSACLVSHVFNHLAIRHLYFSIDAGLSKTGRLLHPGSTLLRRPELAQHVYRVKESRNFSMSIDYPKALELCVNLRSASWIDHDNTDFAESALVTFLAVLKRLPLLQDLSIQTRNDISARAWNQLRQLRGLKKISIWSMEGPPRVLQGWVEKMGASLTHLELGRCAGVPPTILISVFMEVPLLQTLRIRGVPSGHIPMVISYLPNLTVLDFDYIRSTVSRTPPQQLPFLQSLTIRLSMINTLNENDWYTFWPLISPSSSAQSRLRELTLDGKSFVLGENGRLPRSFIFGLSEKQKDNPCFERLLIETIQLTTADILCICMNFPKLKELSCLFADVRVDADIFKQIVARANNLSTLKLQLPQLVMTLGENVSLGRNELEKTDLPIETVREVMECSQLRLVAVGKLRYHGVWVRKVSGELMLEANGEEMDEGLVRSNKDDIHEGYI